MSEYLSISEIMQSAVTPVFLLAGIGALMNVMTGRLGRIIDRLRYLQGYLSRVSDKDQEIILSNILIQIKDEATIRKCNLNLYLKSVDKNCHSNQRDIIERG